MISLYARCAIKSFPHWHAIIFENYSKIPIKMQFSTIKNQIFEKPFRNLSHRTQVNILGKKSLDISPKTFGSSFAKSPRKYSNFKILVKIERKEAKFCTKIYQGHIRI
jgi:hypothetical protein